MAKKITYSTDEGNKLTEGLLEALEKKINREYSQAEKEVEEKLKDYLDRFATKDDIRQEYVLKQYDKYKNGEISWNEYKKARSEYATWRMNQMAVGDRWKEMRDNLASDLANTALICQHMVNDYSIEAYALNFNYGTYLVENTSLVNTAFTLYDKSTVERLIKKNPQLLPMMSNKTKDRIIKNGLQVWNGQKLTSALTQGILQGESIPKIAKRMRGVANMEYKQSIRTARTSMTSAQNGGRQDAFIRANEMGIKQKKQWLATIDDRTRHEHRLLDGQRVDIEEPFRIEGYEILYPADPSAEPEMVYNCRCTMVTMFDGYDKKITDFDIDERLSGMTYDEWKNSKDIKSEPIDKQEKQGKAMKKKYIDDYRRMKNS